MPLITLFRPLKGLLILFISSSEERVRVSTLSRRPSDGESKGMIPCPLGRETACEARTLGCGACPAI